MTIAQQIRSRVDSLEPLQQKALLKFLETFDHSAGLKSAAPRKSRRRKAEISAAVRGIAGMWKDRTDLPKDPVEAVKVIRSRMKSRGRNG